VEHLPRRVPAGDINLLDYLVPILQEFVGDVPIIGDLIEILSGVEDGNLDDVGTWVNNLTSGLGDVQLMANQIADILRGLVVTPINAAIAGVKDWFNDLVGFRESIEPAGYWDLEALVASADVALGVNELLVGMHLHQNRTITGIHYALAANTGTLTVQTRLDGAVIHTATINSGEARKSYTVNVAASDKQRVSWNVTGSTGVATVLSVAVTGEYR
jgi:hypothetical protein